MGNILNTGTTSNSNYGLTDFSGSSSFTPVELPQAQINYTPPKAFNISDELRTDMSDYVKKATNISGEPEQKSGESTMDNVMGYGGLALQFASLLENRKTAKLQRDSLKFNLNNAKELSAARKTAVSGINNVGRV